MSSKTKKSNSPSKSKFSDRINKSSPIVTDRETGFSDRKKSSPKRQKKIYKDTITGLTPGLKRIWALMKEKEDKRKRFDVNVLSTLRVSPTLWSEILITLGDDMKELAKKIAIFREYSKRKGISADDVRRALGRIVGVNDLIMAKLPFSRYIRELLQDYDDNLRISSESFELLQAYYEYKVINLLLAAAKTTLYRGQKTLSGSDIKFINDIKRNICN